jgi:8-oxo-dGTP pyrophosphatase MutT (NUDIX family)
VTGFVVHEGRVALHWHRKLDMWLPAGGHIEANEDPVQAVLREVEEEFGVVASVLPIAHRTPYTGGPEQLEPPHSMLDCIVAPDHVHIDLCYYCKLESGYPGVPEHPDSPILWVDAETLVAGTLPRVGNHIAIAPDVQALGIEAIRQAARFTQSEAAEFIPQTEPSNATVGTR